MPLQNRVTPFGTFERSSARGSLMGNRGILHDDQQNVLKTHTHQNWVACALTFKGIRRQIMAPGHYTELFFLDEATALAAGHRPCARCRPAAYRDFTARWQAVLGGAADGLSLPKTIDRALHAARITRQRGQVTHLAEAADLPDGTIITLDGQPQLLWQGRRYGWSFDGYRLLGSQPQGEVTVLTPAPLVAILRAGYRPEVHGSLESAG
ncbi:hypothetical protein [Arenibacterium sp. LLYu02]|uniref:hypothetical protein n=1 Tax=Arenibacterium sp. LLYu02 TaxID=3404132 RepID=UPI003B2252D4